MSLKTGIISSVFILLATNALTAQFPDYRNYVLDINQTPRELFDDVPHFYPTENGGFFCNFFRFETNSLFYFNGIQLDTPVVNVFTNGRITGEYGGGYLLNIRDTESYNESYTLTVPEYDTTRLGYGPLSKRYAFPNGRTLLSDQNRLYVIDDGPESFMPLGDDVFINCCDESILNGSFIFSDGRDTWITDGTIPGTIELFNGSPSFGTGGYQTVGDLFYFITFQRGLIVSDGTPTGTQPLDFSAIPDDLRPEAFQFLNTTANGLVFAGLNNTSSGVWTTDGTQIGTRRLADIARSKVISNDSIAIFRGGARNDEIWITDGSPDGTGVLLDFSDREIIIDDWDVNHVATLADGTLYFSTNEDFKQPLWVLTPDGSLTELLSISPRGGFDNDFLPTANQLFIVVKADETGLYAHTPGDTAAVRLADLENPRGFTTLENGVLIHGSEGQFGEDPYTVVHHEGQTTTYPYLIGMNISASRPTGGTLTITQTGDTIYGITFEENAGEAVFFMDLTNGETEVIQDLNPNTFGSGANDLVAGDGAAFFKVGNTRYGTKGIDHFEAIPELDDRISSSAIPGSGQTLFYRKNDQTNWFLSDGRADGTNQLPNSRFGPESNVIAFKGDYYYFEDGRIDDQRRYRLMKLEVESGNRTEVFSVNISDILRAFDDYSIASSGEYLYFPMYIEGQWQVWRSDGTTEGTQFYAATLPNTLGVAPVDFRSGDGLVTYKAKSIQLNTSRGTFLISEDSDNVLELTGFTTNDFLMPIRVRTGIVYANDNGINIIPNGSSTPETLIEETGNRLNTLIRVDDDRILYTDNSDGESRLWRYDFTSGERVELIDGLNNFFFGPFWGIQLMDSLALVVRKWQGTSGSFDELRLLNVYSGDNIIATPETGLQEVREMITEGKRFLYVNEEGIYSQEVHVIDFSGERPVNTNDRTITSDFSYKAYPNPNTGWLRLDLPSGGRYVYELFDLAARRLRSETVPGSSVDLDLTSFGDGLYLIKVTDLSNLRSSTKKILKLGGR